MPCESVIQGALSSASGNSGEFLPNNFGAPSEEWLLFTPFGKKSLTPSLEVSEEYLPNNSCMFVEELPLWMLVVVASQVHTYRPTTIMDLSTNKVLLFVVKPWCYCGLSLLAPCCLRLVVDSARKYRRDGERKATKQ